MNWPPLLAASFGNRSSVLPSFRFCALRFHFFSFYQSHVHNWRAAAAPSLEELSTPFKVIGCIQGPTKDKRGQDSGSLVAAATPRPPRLLNGHTVFCISGLFQHFCKLV